MRAQDGFRETCADLLTTSYDQNEALFYGRASPVSHIPDIRTTLGSIRGFVWFGEMSNVEVSHSHVLDAMPPFNNFNLDSCVHLDS